MHFLSYFVVGGIVVLSVVFFFLFTGGGDREPGSQIDKSNVSAAENESSQVPPGGVDPPNGVPAEAGDDEGLRKINSEPKLPTTLSGRKPLTPPVRLSCRPLPARARRSC